MSGGHLLCADRSGTKTHCGGMENVAETTRRRRRILQNRILFHSIEQSGRISYRKKLLHQTYVSCSSFRYRALEDSNPRPSDP